MITIIAAVLIVWCVISVPASLLLGAVVREHGRLRAPVGVYSPPSVYRPPARSCQSN